MPAEFGEPLSERELEIVALVSEGLTNREIAERVFLSPNTIKVHLRNIFSKTGVSSRTELSMKAIQEAWIVVPGTENTDEFPVTVEDSAAIAPPAEPWPWQRWLSVTLAILVCLAIIMIPQLSAYPKATSPGDIYGASTTVYDPLPSDTTGKWEELSPLSARRAGAATTVLGQQLYVIGGMGADGALSRVDRLDIATEQWYAESVLPESRTDIKVALIGNSLYMPGGCTSNGHPVDTLYAQNLDDNVWQSLTPLPQSLCAYALATLDKSLYIFGGSNGSRYVTDSYRYNVDTDTWSAISQPDMARGYGAAAILSGKIYYVGGYDGEREYNTCEVYDPLTDSWALCAPLLQPRGGLGLAAVGVKLYAVGGGWDTNLGFSEQYSPAQDAWSIMETPLVGEWRNIGLANSDTTLYAVGGWDGSDFLNRTYTLEVLPWRVYIPGAIKEP